MLKTDWLKIATAGQALDGRTIEKEWLERIAASYDLEVYTAAVNWEHVFNPGLGLVAAVKADIDERGRTALYAQLIPTAELLERYQHRRTLYFSLEVVDGFPERGAAYLSGLAITDRPASQGLTPVKFNAADGEHQRFFDTASISTGAELTSPHPSAASEDQPPGWFRAFARSLLAGKHEEQQPMTESEQQAFDALQAQVTTLKQEFTALQESTASAPAKEPEAAPGTEGEQGDDVAVRFSAELAAGIAEATAPLIERLSALEAYMGEPVAGAQGEVTGPTPKGEAFVF